MLGRSTTQNNGAACCRLPRFAAAGRLCYSWRSRCATFVPSRERGECVLVAPARHVGGHEGRYVTNKNTHAIRLFLLLVRAHNQLSLVSIWSGPLSSCVGLTYCLSSRETRGPSPGVLYSSSQWLRRLVQWLDGGAIGAHRDKSRGRKRRGAQQVANKEREREREEDSPAPD